MKFRLSIIVPILVGLGLLASIPTPSHRVRGHASPPTMSQRSSLTGCIPTLKPGRDTIQPALTVCPPGTVFTLAGGTYYITASKRPLKPKTGDVLTGAGQGVTILDGEGTKPSALDGITSGATNVTLTQLTITHFGTERGTIAVRTGPGWIVDHVELSYSSIGIKISTDSTLRYSHVHNNYQYGITGGGAGGAFVTRNEVDHNDITAICYTNPSGDQGATKFAVAHGLTVSGNYFHDNLGNGIWFDVGASDGNVVTNNRIENSAKNACGVGGQGIQYEMSCEGTISGNTLSGNAGTAIESSNSYGVTVSNNLVTARGSLGLTAIGDSREGIPYPGAGTGCIGKVRSSVTFSTNTVIMATCAREQGIVGGNTGDTMIFSGNIYRSAGCEYKD
jgi:parallel beta-helix repeat protein